MDPRKCMFLVAGLLFLDLSSPVDACSCLPSVLQNSFCTSELNVLQVIFLKTSQKTGASPTDVVKGYEIQIKKVLKGDQALTSQTFIDSSSGSTCEYKHNPNGFNVEYVITASSNNGVLRVNMCSYIVRWSELSPRQIKGVEGAYLQGCNCNIVACYSPGCSAGLKTCRLEQYEGGDAENQIKNQVCVTKTSAECAWKNIE